MFPHFPKTRCNPICHGLCAHTDPPPPKSITTSTLHRHRWSQHSQKSSRLRHRSMEPFNRGSFTSVRAPVSLAVNNDYRQPGVSYHCARSTSHGCRCRQVRDCNLTPSVLVELKDNGRASRIKIYPRLVHVIKSLNSRLQGDIPKTLSGVVSRS